MSTVLEYKCPNCASDIKFDSKSQKFKCESCDAEFTEQELNDIHDFEANFGKGKSFNWQSEEKKQEMTGVNEYVCQSCAAHLAVDETTAAGECPYCGSPVIMNGKLSGENAPDCVIPFKLDKKQAGEALKAFCKGKLLLPSNFVNENKIKEMKGVYVPFWLFDCDTDADIVYDATRVRSWSDSDYNYTETKHYKIYRSGKLGFKNIPVDASSKMDDAYMDGIEPFNYGDMSDFNPGYLLGYVADKYDVSAQDSFPRAEARVENSTAEAFRSTVHGYTSVVPTRTNINADAGKYKYALLPVWLMSTKYNGERYMFAVNGQTGKVSGKLPIDKKKFWLYFAGIAALVIAIGQFFIF